LSEILLANILIDVPIEYQSTSTAKSFENSGLLGTEEDKLIIDFDPNVAVEGVLAGII